MNFLLIKALHIISVTAWMAGMLYLPRLFVYHAAAKPESEVSSVFKVMERRLSMFIILPAMIASWVSGVLLVHIFGYQELMGQRWFHVKLLFVLSLTGMYAILSFYRRCFVRGERTRSANFFRVLNEVPTLILLAVVLLVVMKPF